MRVYLLKKVENIVANRVTASFVTMFYSAAEASESVYMWERVYIIEELDISNKSMFFNSLPENKILWNLQDFSGFYSQKAKCLVHII